MGKFVLPEWREHEITKIVAELFFENGGIKSKKVCTYLMKKHRMQPIPYGILPGDLQKILCRCCGKYGFIIPLNGGRVLFLYNSRQTDRELRKTLWHELGHIQLGHQQSSQLAEAEADFFMETAILWETILDSILEGLPMDVFTKTV